MEVERFPIKDLLSLTPVRHGDSRGFFSEVYRREILVAEGIDVEFVQENHVYSTRCGVLRGLHFQVPPYAQGKLVRCVTGAILDVAVDIRHGSPTYGHHVALELSAANWKQIWVPAGFAHGYLVLEAPCEVIYKVTQYWTPDSERGLAWDDPVIAINWGMPHAELTLSEKDRSHPRLSDLEPAFQFTGVNS